MKTDKENEWRAWVQKCSFGLFVAKDKDSNPEYANKPFEVVKKSDYDSLKAELEKARELIEAQSKFLNRFKDGFYLNNSFSELVSLYKDLTDFEIKEFLKREGE